MSARMLGLIVFFAFEFAASGQQCSNATLNGTYAFLVSGNITTGNAIVAAAELGTITADGAGTLNGSATASTAGVIQSVSLAGTYSVSSDCVGSLGLRTNQGNSVPWVIQIERGGKSLVMSLGSVAGVMTGRAFRQSGSGVAPQCTAPSFSGAYSYLTNGVIYSGTTPNLTSQAGNITATPPGSLASFGAVNYRGATTQATAIGTYTISSDCTGTAQLTNSVGTATYKLAMIDDGFLVLSTNNGSVVSGTAAPTFAPTSVLPQFAFGGGWYSAVYFTNLSSGTATFPVTFVADTGDPLAVPGAPSGTQIISIPARGSAVIEAPNTGSLASGYVTANLPSEVIGYGVFRQSVTGGPDQEAVVPFGSASTRKATLTFDDTAFTTAVSLANPNFSNTNVSVTARDASGVIVGTSTILLPPRGKTAVVLRSIAGLAGVAGQRGSVEFSAETGIGVLGLRFGALAFTSIPASEAQ